VITTTADAGVDDVNQAVAAARKVFAAGCWAKMAPIQRKMIMHKIADKTQEYALELAVLGVRDNSTEIGMAINAEPGSAAATFRFYAETVDKVYGEIAPTPESVLGLIHTEPVGVVAVIVPWNFPLMIAAWKIVFGLILKRLDMPTVPIILGVVLGPIMEVKLRSSMPRVKTPLDFIDRPIAAIIFGIIVIIIAMHIRTVIKDFRGSKQELG